MTQQFGKSGEATALAPLERLLACMKERMPAGSDRTWLVGVVGLPGSGKSTLTAELLRLLAPWRCAAVSLDDFYLTPAERQARGLGFRGPPGTHDVHLLDGFLEQLASRTELIEFPVYDREAERRLPKKRVLGPLHLCIIEGWFVGARCPGYTRLSAALDFLIYLDMDLEHARAARFCREAALRARGRGGMSDAEVARFWQTALLPHFATLLFPLREQADAVLLLDAGHRISALRLGQ